MFHELVVLVLGVHDSELTENTGVSLIETETLLKKLNELIEVSISIVASNELLEMIGIHDNVKTTRLGKTELSIGNTCRGDFLPGVYTACLSGSIHGLSELVEVYVT